ncbi:MAG TPA: hypothetical protein DCM64_08445 [Gammaproteobacteria bacterium]|jgi:ectoine hydroxylase-related dioxygenase (phytanoyl-CoA dioxygenase family)|nr:phytanoyl-CoA dioxygenase family protein [Gammaproteobacteria bacterium]MDP6731444.1 phytanoyl-CoA dioxygenase family protein [Gammaproteobacteria bacterium]HAJ76474.1 hypothetical protein [Gammaproteobacteria bacterium]|tara:strand:+ start:570 stop:1352 length:783 start_codon:yes stop_codon:yes gene_type:complete
MISDIQKVEFDRYGLIYIKNLIPEKLARAAQEVYFEYFAQKGIRQLGEWVLDAYPLTSPINTSAILAKKLKHQKEFIEVMAPQVESVVEELLNGKANTPMTKYPQLLFTLPNSNEWGVPLGPWHIDVPRFPEGTIPGVQVFTFLDSVRPGNGGTLAVAGSHKLFNHGISIRSKEIARQLQKLNYFEDLMTNEAFDRQSIMDIVGMVEGVNDQVKELTGKPGNIYFMDMRLVHTIGLNAGKIPRAMLTQRYLLEEFRAKME